jgi:hypothetical protein
MAKTSRLDDCKRKMELVNDASGYVVLQVTVVVVAVVIVVVVVVVWSLMIPDKIPSETRGETKRSK